MGIDGKLGNIVGTALTYHAFDRRPGLSLIENDGLIVEDAPAIAHMRVHADRFSASTRVDPCLPHCTRRFQ